MATGKDQGSDRAAEGSGTPRSKTFVEDTLIGLAVIALMLTWGGFGAFWFWIAIALGAVGVGLKVWRQAAPNRPRGGD